MNHTAPTSPKPDDDTGGSAKGSSHNHAVPQVSGAVPSSALQDHPVRTIVVTTAAPKTQKGTSSAAAARRR